MITLDKNFQEAIANKEGKRANEEDVKAGGIDQKEVVYTETYPFPVERKEENYSSTKNYFPAPVGEEIDIPFPNKAILINPVNAQKTNNAGQPVEKQVLSEIVEVIIIC